MSDHIEHWTGERMVAEIKHLRAENVRLWEAADARACSRELRAENDRLRAEVEALKHDIERHIKIASDYCAENERLIKALENHGWVREFIITPDPPKETEG